MWAIVLVAGIALVMCGTIVWPLGLSSVSADATNRLEHSRDRIRQLAAERQDPSSGQPLEDVSAVLRTHIQRTAEGRGEAELGFVGTDASTKLTWVSADSVSFRPEQDKELLTRVSSQAAASESVIETVRTPTSSYRVLVVPSGNEPQGPGQAAGDGAQAGEGHQLGPRGLGVGEGVGERVQAGELGRQGAGTDAGAVQDHQLRGPLRRSQEAAHLGVDLPGPQQGDPGEELEAGDPHPAGLDVLGQGQGLNLVGGDVVGQEQDVVGVQQPDRQHGGGGEGTGVGGQGDREVGRVAHRCFSWEMGAAPSAGAAGVSGMRVRWKDW